MITIDDFNRWHNKKRLCRNPGCPNAPKWPRREYCGDECYTKFIDYYLQHFQWESAKEKVLKRDNYTCVKCGYNDKQIEKTRFREWETYGRDNLEVDHNIARSIMYHIHYVRYYLPVKLKYKRKHKFMIAYWKRLDEQTNALWNLRTLCKQCHKKKTKKDIRKLKLLRKVTGISDYFFFPKVGVRLSGHYDPMKLFDDAPYSFYHMDKYYKDKSKVEFTAVNPEELEKDKYFYELRWVFSDHTPKRWQGYEERDELLSFCIMFDVLENGKVTQFKYMKEDESTAPTLFNYI